VGEPRADEEREEALAHLARLARLQLDAEQGEELQGDLRSLLDFVDQLRELDLSGTDELLRPVAPPATQREDMVRPGLPRQAALSNAPEAKDGMFQVPRTVEEA